MKEYMEYKECEIPKDIQSKLEDMAKDPNQVATLGGAGVFDWLNKLSKEEGWRPVWHTFGSLPFIVLERTIVE